MAAPNTPKSSSSEEGKPKRKRSKSKSKPTTKARNAKQKLKDRYAHAREDAQLAGLIPTTPEEALKDERVKKSAQTNQPLPELIGEAVRKGWAVPEERKPRLVDELTTIVESGEMPAKVKVAAFNALRQADQAQYERDHPEEAARAKSKGTQVNVNVVQENKSAAELIRGMVLSGEFGSIEAFATPNITSASSSSGYIREVEAGPSSPGDEQQVSRGMEET